MEFLECYTMQCNTIREQERENTRPPKQAHPNIHIRRVANTAQTNTPSRNY
jgi:hypothetical protein